jgi:hypothetical protein
MSKSTASKQFTKRGKNLMFDINSYFDYGTADWASTNDLAEAYGLFVKLGSDGQFSVATTAADEGVTGVLRDNTPEGYVPPVRTGSVTYVFAGSDLAVGDYVTNDAEGKAVKANSGQIVLGQVLDVGVAAGQEAKINLILQASRTA